MRRRAARARAPYGASARVRVECPRPATVAASSPPPCRHTITGGHCSLYAYFPAFCALCLPASLLMPACAKAAPSVHQADDMESSHVYAWCVMVRKQKGHARVTQKRRARRKDARCLRISFYFILLMARIICGDACLRASDGACSAYHECRGARVTAAMRRRGVLMARSFFHGVVRRREEAPRCAMRVHRCAAPIPPALSAA